MGRWIGEGVWRVRRERSWAVEEWCDGFGMKVVVYYFTICPRLDRRSPAATAFRVRRVSAAPTPVIHLLSYLLPTNHQRSLTTKEHAPALSRIALLRRF